MRKTIKATNFTLTEAISNYLDKRLSVLNKYVGSKGDSAIVDIEIGRTTNHHKSGDVFRAEANLHMAGIDVRAEVESVDLYSAIDEMKDELVEGLRTKKHRRISIVRRSGLRLKNFLKGIVGNNTHDDF